MSHIGRFTRADDPGYGNPFDLQSMNFYAYVRNNPLRFVDPTGHYDCPVIPGFTIDDCTEVIGKDPLVPYLPYLIQWFLQPRPNYPGGGGGQPGRKAPARPGRVIADVMRCAAGNAESWSLAAILPANTPAFLSNAAGNDISAISDLLTGPARGDALRGIGEGEALNLVARTGARGVGAIRFREDLLPVSFDSSGNPYVKKTLVGTIGASPVGRAAIRASAIFSSAKLAWDVGTYAVALGICS